MKNPVSLVLMRPGLLNATTGDRAFEISRSRDRLSAVNFQLFNKLAVNYQLSNIYCLTVTFAGNLDI